MAVTWLTMDVFDGLATLQDGTVDLCVTSPPLLALRSYLPSAHPDKSKEIGSESTPAEFLDVLLRVTQELRRVLAPHGSIAVELGDTYAGSGGGGGDLSPDSGGFNNTYKTASPEIHAVKRMQSDGWPLAKCKALIPELYRLALAYGINPLTGTESPAGRWRVRNVVTWCRVNPPVGALGDKWRPATSDVVIACTSDKRYWDDIATRVDNPRINETPLSPAAWAHDHPGGRPAAAGGGDKTRVATVQNGHGAPLLDWWNLTAGGYPGSHYAVFPPALVEPLVKAMAPPKVCRTCGEPSRRISETTPEYDAKRSGKDIYVETGPRNRATGMHGGTRPPTLISSERVTLGWTDCGHDNNWRPSLILDPFAGSGTTLSVATGHGHDAIGIDLDPRNEALARDRVGPLMWETA